MSSPTSIVGIIAGNVVTLSVQFVDSAGNPCDPISSTLVLTIQDPVGNLITFLSWQVNRTSTGLYSYSLITAVPAGSPSTPTYAWRWFGSGNGVVNEALEGIIQVTPSLIGTAQPPIVPAFTQESLNAINAAIASGALTVQFQDRKVTYRSMEELNTARSIIINYLSLSANPQPVRQSRVASCKGW